MRAQARATVEAWQRTVEAAARRQAELLAAAGGTPAGPVPAAQRDLANRALLAREKAALEAERDRLTRESRANILEYDPNLDRLAEIDDELRDIAVIESRLNQPPDPNDVEGTRYYLLDFDTNGPGRGATVVIAHGNPDTAANVATYVPGTELDPAQMERLLAESDAMYESANRLGTNSSVITWLGYDTPNTLLHAVSPAYAIEANGALDRFQQDLHAANPGAHHTVVGHSYGSVVVGYAARDGGMPADDILAVGSPGMGVSTAAELGVPVWVLEANGDPVADTEAHGRDPGDDRFGANQLVADPEGRRPTSLGDLDVGSHTAYFFDTPSTRPAHQAIGDVIAGRLENPR